MFGWVFHYHKKFYWREEVIDVKPTRVSKWKKIALSLPIDIRKNTAWNKYMLGGPK